MNLLSLFGRLNHGCALDFNSCRNFRIGQHVEIGERAFEEPPEREADLRSAENERLLSVRQKFLDVAR